MEIVQKVRAVLFAALAVLASTAFQNTCFFNSDSGDSEVDILDIPSG